MVSDGKETCIDNNLLDGVIFVWIEVLIIYCSVFKGAKALEEYVLTHLVVQPVPPAVPSEVVLLAA